MSLEIYPKDYHTRYEISHGIAVMLSAYYDRLGKMMIVVPLIPYNIEALQNDCIVYDTDRRFVYVIQNVVKNSDTSRLTAYGYTAERRLDQRALLAPLAIQNVERDVYAAVNNNMRGLQGIRTAPLKGLPDSADGEIIEEGQLQEKTSSILHAVGLGRRAVWDDEKNEIVYEIYKGVDRTEGIHAVVFSDEQGTAKDLVINDDVSNWKNVAYIVAEFKDERTEIISVGTASGNDRREIWSDRRILQSFDETEAEARQRAKSEAALELARNIRRQNFSVSIDPEELGTMYNIGDVVSCVSVRFGVSFKARVAGVKYTMDITGQKTEVILGEPKLTAIGGLMLND